MDPSHPGGHYARIWIVLLAAVIFGEPFAAQGQKHDDTKVIPLGVFGNMRFTEEHAYGYSVELWRHDRTLVGLLLASEGLQGDTPAGVLEKLQFNEKTGALRFEARLSTGVVYSKEHHGVSSRDLFRFAGVMKDHQIRGRLERLDMLDERSAPRPEELVLRREQAPGEMKVFSNLDSWKVYVAEILKLRGPQWTEQQRALPAPAVDE